MTPTPGRRDTLSPAASDLADALVPVAAEIVGNVHDYDPADTGAVLDRIGVADEQSRALIVVLAAMVDPDRTPAELLAWTDWSPPAPRAVGGGRPALPREHGSERGYQQHRTRGDMPACDACASAHRVAEAAAARRRRAEKRAA